MAKLFANFAFDYTGLDISGLGQSLHAGFDDNVNATVRGVRYQDVVWFEDESTATSFGGTGITVSGEVVTGGTVTGVLAEVRSGANWTQDWLLEGVSVSAAAIYRAALTTGRTDDLALVAQALAGADVLQLSNFNDKMRGYAGNDLMIGLRGNDVLLGDAGNDTLVGGAGKDILTGNAGDDVFDFNLASESAGSSRDVITDFLRGADRIDLSGIDANTATAGNQAFTGFVPAGAAFTRAGQLKVVDGVLYGNTDADAAAEFAIALTGVNKLSVADVVL